jgi:hypothetical protein
MCAARRSHAGHGIVSVSCADPTSPSGRQGSRRKNLATIASVGRLGAPAIEALRWKQMMTGGRERWRTR